MATLARLLNARVVPLENLILGMTLLVVVLSIHWAGLYTIHNRYMILLKKLVEKRSMQWAKFSILFFLAALISLHLLEIILWSHIVPLFEGAVKIKDPLLFAFNCYTTLGTDIPPECIKLLIIQPLIALSGILAVGWSTGFIVEMSSRRRDAERMILKGEKPSDEDFL